MLRPALLPVVLLASLVPEVTAQRTWIVDLANRPGTHFVWIQGAVQAASPGDTILVRSTGSPYGGATIDRGVYLVGESEIELYTELRIQGIPADQHVTVKRFRMHQNGYLVGGLPITCTGCAGTVHFERVTSPGSMHGPGLQVEDCAFVSAVDCAFDSGATMSLVTWPNIRWSAPRQGIHARRSAMVLTRCSMLGVSFPHPALSPYLSTAGGMLAEASRLVLVACATSGGDSACPTLQGCTPPYVPAAALTLRLGSSLVTKDTSYAPGRYAPCQQCTAPSPGIDADAQSSIRSDPSSSFTHAGGTLVQKPIADLQGAGVPPGSRLVLTLRSSTHAPYVTFASFPAAHRLPPIDVWIDPLQAVLLFSGTVKGSQADALTVPPFLPAGSAASFQSVLLVGTELELSTPAVVALH